MVLNRNLRLGDDCLYLPFSFLILGKSVETFIRDLCCFSYLLLFLSGVSSVPAILEGICDSRCAKTIETGCCHLFPFRLYTYRENEGGNRDFGFLPIKWVSRLLVWFSRSWSIYLWFPYCIWLIIKIHKQSLLGKITLIFGGRERKHWTK